MRVTDSSIFANANAATQTARERYEKATDRASTGVSVRHPWETDSAGQIARERFAAVRASGISTTTSRALDDVNAADGALSSVINTLSRAQQLAIQMSNGTYNSADRASAASQATQMLAEAVSALNIDVGGRFVMGGTVDNAAPFQADGSYTGDAGVRQIEVAPGVVQGVSVRADVVIKGAGGGVDVLQALGDLATALSTNDTTGLRASIDTLRSGIAQVGAGRADAGGIELGLDAAQTAAGDVADAADGRRAGLTDADIAKAATDSRVRRALARRRADRERQELPAHHPRQAVTPRVRAAVMRTGLAPSLRSFVRRIRPRGLIRRRRS